MLVLAFAPIGSYQNPVWREDFPDPFVVQSGKKFYAYATHRDDSGFQCLESEDLVHWTRRPAVFRPSWSDGHFWAPEVHQWHNKWYLVYSARNRTSQKHDVAIAVGSSPVGPFHELATLVDGRDNRVGDIDATLFFDKGRAYLLYSAEEPRSIQIVPLSRDLSRIEGSATVLVKPDRPIEKGVTEAPTLTFHSGRYWLFYSSGWFQSYKRDACYQVWAAPSNRLLGPYVKPAKPLLQTRPGLVYSPGHQALLDLPSGETWIFYHAWDDSAEPLYDSNRHGRTLRMDRVRWTASGPVCDGPTVTAEPAPELSHR